MSIELALAIAATVCTIIAASPKFRPLVGGAAPVRDPPSAGGQPVTRPCFVLGCLVAAATAGAEFTPTEKTNIKRVVESCEGLRVQAVTAPAQDLAALFDRSEACSRTLFLLYGGVVGRNPAERTSLCQPSEPLNWDTCTGPRSEYLNRAYAQLALSGITVNFDQGLGYADIWPQDSLTLFHRTIGPHGPYQPTQTLGWRAAGQYAEDSKRAIGRALASSEVPPAGAEALARQALDALQRAQTTIIRGAARFARLGFDAEEVQMEEENPRAYVQRPVRDWTADASGRFDGAIKALAALSKLDLGPVWREEVGNAISEASDAWGNLDDADWEALKIPETGI